MSTEMNFMIENFNIDDALGHMINRAAIIIRKQFTMKVKEAGYDITPEEFSILSRLWEEDRISQTELVEKTLKDKTRVTRLLSGLIDKSYVKKEIDEADRRNYIVYLTEEGKALKISIIPIVIELMKQAAEGIQQEDIDATKRVLGKVFKNLNS